MSSVVDRCESKTIADELAIAHRALKEGDLGHAAFHIASALVIDQESPEALAVFDGWLAAADDPLRLVTNRDNAQWEGWGAMRARTLAAMGRANEAVPLLGELAAHAPHKSYLSWLSLVRDDDRVQDDAAKRTSLTLLQLAFALPAPLAPIAPARPTAEAALALLAEWRETKRQLPEPLHALTVLLRKFGRTAEALAAARSLFELRPDFFSAGTLATTLRAAGEPNEALQIARRAVELAPLELKASTLLDVGDLCLQLERPGEARQAYAQALEFEAENAWAAAGLVFARFREQGQDADRVALRKFVIEHPEDQHAAQLLHQIGEPPIDRPLCPGDAMAQGLRQIQEAFLKEPPSSPCKLNLTLSAPEGPSNTLALNVLGDALALRFELELSVTSIPTPDPREPLPGVEVTLWRRTGDSFEAALEVPDAAVQREVGVIAATPYQLAVWAERARILGKALGATRVRDLLATMVHPPALPHVRFDPPLWVQQVQIAVALAIAHVDRDWEGSTRRKTLLSIARGPVDWTVTAAIVALMWIAIHEPRTRQEIEGVFQELRQREPTTGGCTYDAPLRQAWLQIPNLSAETRTLLSHELQHLLQGAQADPPHTPPASPPSEPTNWRVTTQAWAIALSGALASQIWPNALGDWWILVGMITIGLGFWFWSRTVRPHGWGHARRKE